MKKITITDKIGLKIILKSIPYLSLAKLNQIEFYLEKYKDDDPKLSKQIRNKLDKEYKKRGLN